MWGQERAKLSLFGPFGLVAPSGARIDVTSKKGAALIAMLALSSNGERTRGWLQDRLWGSRERTQAQNSLRRELSHLRAVLAAGGVPILTVTGDRVSLDLAALDLAVRRAGQDLLEGFDIPGEDGFEEWLREQRQLSDARGIELGPVTPQLPVPPAFHRTPSIAILPFANLTGDPAQVYLADGIGDELIEKVSRLRWLPVISPGDAFSADAGESSLDAGRRLGAAYVLGGKLRREGEDYWLSAQIIDCATGWLVWSPRLRLPAPQASNAMDPVVAELVAALENRVDNAEQVRARARPETDLTANDLVWRGRWHQDRMSHEDTALAGRYLSEAMRLAPESAHAAVEYARHLVYLYWNTRAGEAEFRALRAQAQRAIILDPSDARGHLFAGIAEMWLRSTARAEILFLRAINLNPSQAIAHEQLGTLKILDGQPEAGIELMRLALRLSPADHRLFYRQGELALANLMLGAYAAALDHAEQAIILRPSYWHAHVTRINALARSERRAEAVAAHGELLASRSRFTLDYVDWIPFVDRRWNASLKDAMAGLG